MLITANKKQIKEECIMAYFNFIDKVKYEGIKSKNPFAFKFYDANKVFLVKPMIEHLPFSMAWWHNLCSCGQDMFGLDSTNKSYSLKVILGEISK